VKKAIFAFIPLLVLLGLQGKPQGAVNSEALSIILWSPPEGQNGRTVTNDLLEGMSVDELGILKNAVYARHGRIFKDESLKKFFQRFDWYKEDPAYKVEMLTATDKKNIALISDYEKKLKEQVLDPALAGVANWYQYGKLDEEQLALLKTNRFYVSKSDARQLFYIYEENDYKDLPSFITVDCGLQLFHMYNTFILRQVEQEKLYPLIKGLSVSLGKRSLEQYRSAQDTTLKASLGQAAAFFGVPALILQAPLLLPPALQKKSLFDKKQIDNHKGIDLSAVMAPDSEDFTQYVPRGHYSRNATLKRYFKAMMWCGRMGFNYKERKPALTSILITRMLHDQGWEDWKRIYEVTAFFVGKSDDPGPEEYWQWMQEVYGTPQDLEAYADPAKMKQFRALVEKKYPAVIVPTQPEITIQPYVKGFRFMGQRYIPDSDIMQQLCHWPERTFPKGLDAFGVFQSPRAEDLLLNFYKEPEHWKGYLPAYRKLQTKFANLDTATWHSNIYYGWLHALNSLTKPMADSAYPDFMRTVAYQDKSLTSALASWAELRHDTILYSKPFIAAECGDGEIETPPTAKGYVEPNLEFYKRMLLLVDLMEKGLDENKVQTNSVKENFAEFRRMLKFLLACSEKELKGEALREDEQEQIRKFGGQLENLTLRATGCDTWFKVPEVDRSIPVAADVGANSEYCLEEAVGYGNEILVIVPIEGKLYLARGAVLSYHEFEQPIAERLTDEKWQEIVFSGKAPLPPEWTKSFLSSKKTQIPVAFKRYSTAC